VYCLLHSTMPRPAEIATIIKGVERYNAQSLPVLEAYLQERQLAGDEYDLLANLAILKLSVPALGRGSSL
jgi:hypothetical protein